MNKADLAGFVLADEDGLCIATAGDDIACDEVAAYLPVVGQKVNQFEGVLFGPKVQWNIKMQKLEVAGIQLFLCAIGESEARNDQLDRSAAGVSRILNPLVA